MSTYLQQVGFQVEDYGTAPSGTTLTSPPEVTKVVAQGEHDRALLVCGTGLEMAITANKVSGVRGRQLSP